MRKRVLVAKRVVVICLCLAMIAAFSGCGKGSDSSSNAEGSADEVQEITLAFWDADQALAGDEVLEKVESELNIKIKPVNVSWDDYAQKIQLWGASGSLPDVFVGDIRNSKMFAEWASQGIIKAIPEDLSQYPNLETYLSDEATTNSARIDGTLFCIPRKSYPAQEWTAMDREIVYRWDLAQAAGITKEPETWEEFDTMIQAIIAADPDKTSIQGMTSGTTGFFARMFLPYASSIACDMDKWVQNEDGTYEPAYFAEDLTPAFQLMRDLYTSGTIEKDIALTDNQTAREKFLQGKSAAIFIGGGIGKDNYTNVAKYWKEIHGEDYLADVKVLKLMPDVDGNPTYPIVDFAWSETYINASVTDQKMDKILQLFEYLLTEEGSIYTTYGPEGSLYDMVDGQITLHEDADILGTYPSIGVFKDMVQWSPSSYSEVYPLDEPIEYKQINQEIVEQAKTVEIPEYNSKCAQIVKELGLGLSNGMEDDVINIMTGQDPVDQMWDEIYKQYQNKGLDDVVQQVNDSLNS
ncbi:MAG: extracellular solute-binding protein [Lachnospiraceae bacterium]